MTDHYLPPFLVTYADRGPRTVHATHAWTMLAPCETVLRVNDRLLVHRSDRVTVRSDGEVVA